MKKLIVGALVTAIILFIWQFLSWAMLNIHGSQMQYTSEQASIMECLEGKLGNCTYFMPTVPPRSTQEVYKAARTEAIGKPWAKITYNDSFDNNMGMNMFRGFSVNLIAAFILCWVLLQFAELNMSKALMTSPGVGLIGYLSINYINGIWFEGNSIPDLVDAVVPWSLSGLWLGFWLRK